MPTPSLILGPLPALEDALAGEISSSRPQDPLAPATVLVGQSLLKRYLPRMLAARGVPQINVRYVLADELAESLATDEAREEARMSRAAERLIARVAAEVEGPYFADTVRSDGFVTAMVRLSRELERGGFEPGRLAGMLREAGVTEAKAEHLAAIYAEERRLRREAMLAGPAELQAGVWAERLEGPLFVYGLWNLAATTLAMLDGIASSTNVTVFLPAYVEEQEEHSEFRAWLKARGAVEARSDGGGSSLAHAVLGRPAGGVAAADVALVGAPDTVREVWEAARTCLTWAESGIPFHEMAVAYRHRDQHRALVDEIFRQAKIPAYMHDGSPLSEHPKGRALLALLELLADAPFSRQRVMEFITETRFPKATREAYPGLRPAEWDTYSREAGVVEGMDQWRTRLQRLANSRRERSKAEGYEWLGEHAERIETLLAFVEELHDALTGRPATAPWEMHLAFVRGFADRYADGLSEVLGALDELKSLAAVEPLVTFEVFAQAVREDLQTRDTSRVLGEPVREFGRHGVAVMDASSLRHMRFRAVYLLGLKERAWPAPARPDPLLLEHERAALNLAAAAGGAHIPLRNAPDEEPLTFRLCIDAAKERLVASYARAQASRSGRHVPSYFFRSLAETLTGRTLTMSEMEAGGVVRRLPAGRLSVVPIEASVTSAEYDRGLIQRGIGAGFGGVIEALALERAVALRRARWGAALTAYDGVLLSEEAKALAAALEFGRKRPVSASRLELYALCPYKYFLQYVLRIEPIDEPEALDGIDHLERGSLIHAILEGFLKRLGRDDPPRADARERHIKVLLAVAEGEAKRREENGVTGRGIVWAIERKQIFDDLIRWYDAEVRDGAYSSMRPHAFEVGFGGPGYRFGDETSPEDPLSSEEPVVFDADGLAILLQGRIDRVDMDEAGTRFRVIDYKTGKKGDRVAPDRGRALQLPLYLHAAAQVLGLPAEQGEAQYFYCTRRGEFHRSPFTGADLSQRREDIELVLRTIAEGVDGGYFAPNPGKGADNCRFCEYKLVCNAGIDRIMDRKDVDGPAAAFIAMQDIK